MMKLAFFILIFPILSMAGEMYHIKEASSYQSYFYEVKDSKNNDYSIAAHLWSNQNEKLMLVQHGYLDNCAVLKPLERWFLLQGYDVLCLELPGHGNSSGKRADISHISAYYETFQSILPQVFQLKYTSFSFYGHSTGNVSMIESLLNRDTYPFKKIIMATPLIRSYLWDLSKFGQRILGNYIQNLPKRPNGIKDPEYLAINSLDPKPFKTVPSHWFHELVKWNNDLLDDTRVVNDKIYVLFGTNDTVIDTSFNRSFMMKHFPGATFMSIQGSGHILHYEKESVRKEFYATLQRILELD